MVRRITSTLSTLGPKCSDKNNEECDIYIQYIFFCIPFIFFALLFSLHPVVAQIQAITPPTPPYFIQVGLASVGTVEHAAHYES